MSSTLDALTSGGKRTKVHNAQLVVKLPQGARDLVTAQAGIEQVSEATVVRWALAEYFERRGLGG